MEVFGNRPPENGTVSASAIGGDGLVRAVLGMTLLRATGWVDRMGDYPLEHSFFVDPTGAVDPTDLAASRDPESLIDASDALPLRGFSTRPNASIYLPEGASLEETSVMTVIAMVRDSAGSVAAVGARINVLPAFDSSQSGNSVAARGAVTDQLSLLNGASDSTPEELLGGLAGLG